VDGQRDILGLWAGEHGDGEGAKFWLRVLTEIKNRGVRDVCLLVCDGLKARPTRSAPWAKTIVQTCIAHLLRNSFRYASKRDWGEIAKGLKPVYTAASEAEALDQFAEFSGTWEQRCPAIIRMWENAWAEFVPFLAFDREIRAVICTTNPLVIWRHQPAVDDVHDGGLKSRDLRAGRGYLLPSGTQVSGGSWCSCRGCWRLARVLSPGRSSATTRCRLSRWNGIWRS
jgi:mutator family transposase